MESLALALVRRRWRPGNTGNTQEPKEPKMKTILLSLSVLLAVTVTACGDNTEPEAQESAATTLPECPSDGTMLYFAGCANAPTSHVCNDARGVQKVKDCVIHDAEGTLTATCVAACP